MPLVTPVLFWKLSVAVWPVSLRSGSVKVMSEGALVRSAVSVCSVRLLVTRPPAFGASLAPTTVMVTTRLSVARPSETVSV